LVDGKLTDDLAPEERHFECYKICVTALQFPLHLSYWLPSYRPSGTRIIFH